MNWVLIVVIWSASLASATSFTVPMKSESACHYAMENAEDLGNSYTSAHCINTETGHIISKGQK